MKRGGEQADTARKAIQEIRNLFDDSAGFPVITGLWTGSGTFKFGKTRYRWLSSETHFYQQENGKIKGYIRWSDSYEGGVTETFEGTIDKENRITIKGTGVEDIVNTSISRNESGF